MKRVKVSKKIVSSEDSLVESLEDLISFLEETSNEYYNDAEDFEEDAVMRSWYEGMAKGTELSAKFIRERLMRWER